MEKIYKVYHVYEKADFISKEIREDCVAQFTSEIKAKKFVEKYQNIHANYLFVPDRWEDGEEIGRLIVKEESIEWQLSEDKMWWLEEDDDEDKYKEDMENMQKAIDGVTLLEKAKEVFAPFDLENHFTKEDFKGYVKELHNAILEADLNIYLFDGKYDYYPDGTIEEWNGRERFKYSAIHIPFDCGLFDGLIYNCGNYDIDKDIERLREFIEEMDQIIQG